jgi:hypothetical protein
VLKQLVPQYLMASPIAAQIFDYLQREFVCPTGIDRIGVIDSDVNHGLFSWAAGP